LQCPLSYFLDDLAFELTPNQFGDKPPPYLKPSLTETRPTKAYLAYPLLFN